MLWLCNSDLMNLKFSVLVLLEPQVVDNNIDMVECPSWASCQLPTATCRQPV